MIIASARRTFPLLALAAALALPLSACTKKRPQVFTQGQGANLDTIESWHTRFVDLTTGDVIGTPLTTRAQEKVSISEDVRIMNHFELVELRISDPQARSIVQSPPFSARANAPVGVYQLEIKLTDNYLKVYKVGRPRDLPFEEHFYKEETLADGRLAIPILGYKIKAFYRVEPEKTSDDKEGHHLVEVEEPEPSRATHVRIDWGSRELFEPVRKIDLFPAELFFSEEAGQLKPYEWYYAETVTEKSLSDPDTLIGETGVRTDNSKLSPATKVVFLPRESELRVVNVARDERLSRDQIQNSADLNSEATLLLPIGWRDYRTQSEGSSLGLKGETVNERKWSERKYFEIDFLGLQSAGVSSGTNRLIDIEIDRQYFSFTLQNLSGSKGRKIHYSFLRADRDRLPYTPKRSFKEDRNTFGYFSTIKPFYPNWQYYIDADFRKREFLSRMNPAREEIVFHLSKESPRDLETVATDAVAAWDRAFQAALTGTGRQIRVRLDPSRTELGDLRYNTIHLVDTLNEDGLLGFGPSVADPETGEIVAATTNVYVNSFQAIAAGTVRQYVIQRLEKRLEFDPEVKEPKRTPILADPADAVDPVQLLPRGRARYTLDTLSTAAVPTAIPDPQKLIRDEAPAAHCEYAATIAGTSSDLEIRKNCPDVESIVAAHAKDDFAGALSEENWNRVWTEAKGPIEACSRRLTREKLLSTLIHEIGHNFGLRHNFYGSVDQANFREVKTESGAFTPQSSSIMEYPAWDDDRMTEAGPYDIAAIRFGYGDRVDLRTEGSVKVEAEQPITEALRANGRSRRDLKPYLFCTDEEAVYSFDALCRMHDSGTSPEKIVDYYISLYQRLQETRRFRRARPSVQAQDYYAQDVLNRIFIPLKEIYDQWRYQVGEYVRKSNRYLVQYTPEEYEAALQLMEKNDGYQQAYRQYRNAGKKIYEFFRDVAFGSNQYCLVQESTGARAIEFERLRDWLSESTRGQVLIRNCAEAEGAAALAQVLGDPSPKIAGETGYPLHSYRFVPASTTTDSLVDDVVGNERTRRAAAEMISFRLPNVRNTLNRFLPNMLDEPPYFEEIKSLLQDRAANGVSFDPALGIKRKLPLFEQEGTLYAKFFQAFRAGITAPNSNGDAVDLQALQHRLAPLVVRQPVPNENVSDATAVLRGDNGEVLYASKGSVLGNTLINAYQLGTAMLNQQTVSGPDAVTTHFESVLPAAAELDRKTVGDLKELYAKMLGFKAGYTTLYRCLLPTSELLQQLEQVFGLFEAEYPLSKKQEAELLARPLAAWLQASLKQPLKATRENVSTLAPILKTCVDQQNVVGRHALRYRKDYEAQKTLILNALNTFAY